MACVEIRVLGIGELGQSSSSLLAMEGKPPSSKTERKKWRDVLVCVGDGIGLKLVCLSFRVSLCRGISSHFIFCKKKGNQK
jgi:hypothetical protein